jgi:porin
MRYRYDMSALAVGVLLCLSMPTLAQDEIKNTASNNESGFQIALDYTGDVISVVDGGIDRGTTYTGLANVSVGYVGADWSWQANAYVPHGDSPTEKHVGDFAVVSNIDMGDLDPRLQEFWVERRFENTSVRFGMLAADTEFWGVEGGGIFVSSVFGAPSIVSANLPNPSIFPTATAGVRVDFKAGDNGVFRAAVLDGDAGDPETENPHGVDVERGEGALVLAEYQHDLTGDSEVPYSYRVSGFYHSGDFVDFKSLEVKSGYWGLMATADVPVSENIGWFGRVGYGSRHRSLAPWSLETGLNVYNAFGSKGTLGVGFAWVDLNSDFDPLVPDIANEKILEVTYDYAINDHFSIQPDIQYIMNTGGVKSGDDTLVLGVRGKLSFSN